MAVSLGARLVSICNMQLSITELLLFVTLTILFYYLRKESRSYKFCKSFPGPRLWPIVGGFLDFPRRNDLLRVAEEHQTKYGTRMPLLSGPFQLLWLTHPNDVAKVLSSKDRTTDKFWLYPAVFSDWLGSSLFLKLGKEYFVKRKMIMPAFNFGILENFSTIFNRNSKVLVDILKPREANGDVVEIHHLLNLCALDIIFESATGTSVHCLHKLDHEFPIAHIQEFKFLYERAFSPWFWYKFIWDISPQGRKERINRARLHGFIEKIIRERRAEILAKEASEVDENGNYLEDAFSESKSEKRRILLDLLLHEQKRGEIILTDKDIRDETAFFVFAGHDTTSSTLTWAVYLLASHPEEQEKLHLELDSIFGDDRTRDIEPSDLPEMRYLDCIIKETLRLYPPAPFLARKIERDLPLDEKTTIPDGTEVLLFPWLTHRLSEFWPEPAEFRPWRFFPENSIGRHPYAFIAFSGGPRNCMGQKYAIAETKTILAHLFRNFYIELNSREDKVTPIAVGTVTPLEGIHVKLRSR